MTKKVLAVFTEKYSKIENRILNKIVLASNNVVDQALSQWDTGATNTCISEEVAQRYKLRPIGKVQSKTPSGTLTSSVYLIDIILNNEVIFKNWQVTESKIGAQGIDVLIGMDIISKGDFSISNFDGKTQFSFRLPSQSHVDYKKDIDKKTD